MVFLERETGGVNTLRARKDGGEVLMGVTMGLGSYYWMVFGSKVEPDSMPKWVTIGLEFH